MRIITIIGFVLAITLCVLCTIDYVKNFMSFENIIITTIAYFIPYTSLALLSYHAYLEYKSKPKE